MGRSVGEGAGPKGELLGQATKTEVCALRIVDAMTTDSEGHFWTEEERCWPQRTGGTEWS